MENYPTMFQSSSSTIPQNSHLSVMDMVNSNSQNYDQFQGYTNLMTRMENIPVSGMDNTSVNCEENDVKSDKKKEDKKARRAKYAFQTRSQVDILDDGYRWRKYGQKAVKNNKFPRSYYRCTHQGCNVKKQVQRLSRDEGIVVTTYEGMHSHPIEKSTDNFEHILSKMQIYTPVL